MTDDSLAALRNSVTEAARTLAAVEAHLPTVAAIARALADSLARGGKLLACGNGGSAAEAQHLTGEWVGRFVRNRRSYPAIALSTDGALLTCLGNDYGFDQVFSRQVEGLGVEGDILVVFSSSGNSENLLRALHTARERGITTVALLGRDGGRTRGVADHEIIVDATVTARIQEAHGLILHLLCEETERLLGVA